MTLRIVAEGHAKCGKSRLLAVIQRALAKEVLSGNGALLPDTVIFEEVRTQKETR